MFEIEGNKALLNSINPRGENHGDETKLACDIGLKFKMSNRVLDMLQPGLCALMYQKDALAGVNTQEGMEFEEGALPYLRFPALGKFPWAYNGAGYQFHIINDTLNGDEVIAVKDCKVNNFQIECQEGGTIELSVRIQGNPDEETIGQLCHYLKQDVKVSLLPPEVSTQEELPVDDDMAELEEALEDAAS